MNQVFEPHVPLEAQLPYDTEVDDYIDELNMRQEATHASGYLALISAVHSVPIIRHIPEAYESAMDAPLASFERDDLTGAYRREALPALEQKFKDSTPINKITIISVIDLDDIKRANAIDYKGADELFAGFARRAKQVIREDDSLIRWGGDEFVLLFNVSAHNADAEAQAVLDRLKMAYSTLDIDQLHGLEPTFTASFVSEYDCDYFEQGVLMAMGTVAQQKAERVRVTADRETTTPEALRRFLGHMRNIIEGVDPYDDASLTDFGDQLFDALRELDHLEQ